MTRLILFFTLTSLLGIGSAADWKFTGESSRSEKTVGKGKIAYAKRTVRSSSGRSATLDFVFFTSKYFRLEVVDQGAGSSSRYNSLSSAFRATDCFAGVNGGFFDPEFRPLGLMIAQGKRVGTLSKSGSLTTGVLYCDPKGIHITRRGSFKEGKGIIALLQTGPYLVEHAKQIKGLNSSKSRRRTFIATDWRGNWAIGITSSMSLADLGEILASSKPVTGWKVNRALNLDGGSSTGLFFDKDEGYDVAVQPWKRVRNLLGVAER